MFSFVTSDVVAKLQTLEEYLNSEEGEHYETIHSMVEYELGSNPNLRTSGKKEATGARTLLRLHRALNFCSKLSEGVANVKMDEKMSTMAWDVYNEALAPYHMWLIRKGVGVAMYALPTKQNLYEKSGLTSEEEGNQLMLEAAKSMEPVYNSVQKLYEEHDLLELPWIIFGRDHFLSMGLVNERQRYIVMSSLIGWAHIQSDHWFWSLKIISKIEDNLGILHCG